MRKSKFDKFSKQELQNIIDNSDSVRSVIKKVGLSGSGMGSYKTFYGKIEEFGLDVEELKKRSKTKSKQTLKLKKQELETVLVKNSTYQNTSNLKKRLLSEKLLKNVCNECGQLPDWNGKKLVLQLDHKNGVNNDNRLSNLRLLCPNCHSQCPTTAGKKLKKKYRCKDCNKVITKHSKTGLCLTCSCKDSVYKKKFDPNKQQLIQVIKKKNSNMSAVGRHYGVSCNAIRKRCAKLGIDWKNL